MTISQPLSTLIQQSSFLVTGGAGFIGSHLVDFFTETPCTKSCHCG